MSAIHNNLPPLGTNSPTSDPEPPQAQESMPVAKKAPDVPHFPKPPRASYQPQCSHITMTRAYGATCQNCNRKGDLGWVWQCTYDESEDPWAAIADVPPAADACDPSDPIAVMKALKMQHSVIDQAEKGLYTPEQIESLNAQKQKVYDTINSQHPDKAAEGNVQEPEAVDDSTTLIANLVRQELRAVMPDASETAVAKERAKHARTVNPRCRYKCCQSCRGDYRGRAFESFDAVFKGEVKPLRPSDILDLPVRDLEVMRNIGMKSPPPLVESSDPTDSENSEPEDIEPEDIEPTDSEPTASIRTWRTTDSAIEFHSRESAQARAFYRVEPVNDMGMYESMHFNDFSFRRSIRNSVSLAVNHVFGKRRESSSDGSAVTLPAPRSTKSSKKLQDSGLSLPTSFFSPRNFSTTAIAPSTIMREGMPTPAPTCSSNSSSSLADDDGGVSLIEEPVDFPKPSVLPPSLETQA